jgi:hypothetical protein
MKTLTINKGKTTERLITFFDLPELRKLEKTKDVYVIFKGIVIFPETLSNIILKLEVK